MIITIRKFSPSIDNGILEFKNGCTAVHTGNSIVSVPFCQEDFQRVFYPDGIWLAHNGTAAIGAILFGKSASVNPSCEVFGIQVDGEYRRRGIGGTLMYKAEIFAQSARINQLNLHTRPDNKPALTLFKKCWFKITESSAESLTMVKRIQFHVPRTKTA
jgi:GNAT superfamily N-acetyltransferase